MTLKQANENFINSLVERRLYAVVHMMDIDGVDVKVLDAAFVHRHEADKYVNRMNEGAVSPFYWVDSAETRREVSEKFAQAMVDAGCIVEGFSEDFELEARRHLARLAN